MLVIGTTGSQTSFLPEGELPECARLAYGAGRDDVRPEDIADQELAEAIQKSVEEAGTGRSPVEIRICAFFFAACQDVFEQFPFQLLGAASASKGWSEGALFLLIASECTSLFFLGCKTCTKALGAVCCLICALPAAAHPLWFPGFQGVEVNGCLWPGSRCSARQGRGSAVVLLQPRVSTALGRLPKPCSYWLHHVKIEQL